MNPKAARGTDMKLARDLSHPSGHGIARSDAPIGLAAIRRPDCAAAIWERTPLPRFQAWLDGLPPAQLPRSRVILRPERICEALETVADLCGTPEGPDRDLLIEDAAALAAIFADIMGAEYLRLRLDVVADNSCRKFHIDAVSARLICTYRGAGTQYGIARDGQDPERVRSVATGSPIILRGTGWPEAPLSGLLHRSPPNEGRGETRLVLVIDPVEDPAPAPDRHFIH